MSLSDDCLEFFGTTDLYLIFNIKHFKKPTLAQIKKAYYKVSLLYHPDRFHGEEHEKHRELATKKFQTISRAYNLLSDDERRDAYEATGSLNEDDTGDTNWHDVFHRTFKKFTSADIDKFLKEYMGSDKQIDDVKVQYIKYEGDMDKIIQSVIGFDPESEERLREIIWQLINEGEVEEYDAFINEPPSARQKRLRHAKKEAKEATKFIKMFKEETGCDDLVEAIRQNQRSRANNLKSIIDKYEQSSTTKKTKKKRAAIQNEEEEAVEEENSTPEPPKSKKGRRKRVAALEEEEEGMEEENFAPEPSKPKRSRKKARN